jgi:hypothetical protein
MRQHRGRQARALDAASCSYLKGYLIFEIAWFAMINQAKG